ncbi:MAG: chemotaxis protein CheA [Steroidobacteraceae bacterium]
MNVDEALPAFIAESADLLREMEAGLLHCSSHGADAETINLIFRSAHTIKGSSGLFGLQDVVAFVHVVETVLDRVRLGQQVLDDALVTLLLACKDHIEVLIEQIAAGSSGADAALLARGDNLIEQLKTQSGAAAESPGEVEELGTAQVQASPAGEAEWGVQVRFGAEVFRAGMDPLGFIRYLTTFGELTRMQVLTDQLPSLAELDPEQCHLGFDLGLRTSAGKERIEAAFEFVREDCTLEITPPARRAGDQEGASAEVRADLPESAAPARATGSTPAQSIRVDAPKLDTLITRIGELIIAAARTKLLAQRAANTELEECASTLSELVEQVRESALQLRMVRIGGTFERFQRVVRDVSRELGKDIQLQIRGEDTELDKTVVEKIGDPLTHLVRNAIDHGIESAAERQARGKSAVGTVTLNAYHDSGSIVIEVGDDGGGMRRDRILAKAIERGLADAEQTYSDSEVFGFIFEPGFSTAAAVTNLSGRGVGMDVVKRNISALRGSIAIGSIEGQGSTITIRLPLTLAIINGFQIGVGQSTFVLPLEAIDECIEYSAAEDRSLTELRGQVLPFVRLRDMFSVCGTPARRQSIVVVRHAGVRAGLVVDTLLGECQTVIKPLGGLFRNADYASGSSILGNGDVALILDVPALVRRATLASERAAFGNEPGPALRQAS